MTPHTLMLVVDVAMCIATVAVLAYVIAMVLETETRTARTDRAARAARLPSRRTDPALSTSLKSHPKRGAGQ